MRLVHNIFKVLQTDTHTHTHNIMPPNHLFDFIGGNNVYNKSLKLSVVQRNTNKNHADKCFMIMSNNHIFNWRN